MPLHLLARLPLFPCVHGVLFLGVSFFFFRVLLFLFLFSFLIPSTDCVTAGVALGSYGVPIADVLENDPGSLVIALKVCLPTLASATRHVL